MLCLLSSWKRKLKFEDPLLLKRLMIKEFLPRLQMVLAVDMEFHWKNCTEKLLGKQNMFMHELQSQLDLLRRFFSLTPYVMVLSEELPGILAKISFPKSMRWNSSWKCSFWTLQSCFSNTIGCQWCNKRGCGEERK